MENSTKIFILQFLVACFYGWNFALNCLIEIENEINEEKTKIRGLLTLNALS
jgi:hypothetical protein